MDCDETYAKVTDLVGTEISANLAYYSFVHRKNLFRSGYFKCSGTAEVNQTPGEVGAVCYIFLQCGFLMHLLRRRNPKRAFST